ncbi:37S ribosomal protein S22, partial [Ascosphaera atra]
MYRVRPQVRGLATSSLARRALLRPRCERLSDINSRTPHFTPTRGIADSAYRSHIAIIPKPQDQSPKDEFIIPRISSPVTPELQKWEVSQERKDDVFSLIDTIYKTEDQIASLLDKTGLLEEFQHVVYSEELDLVDSLRFIIGYRDEQDLLTEVSRVRQVFGDHPPTELMSDEALTAFIRLYGEPRPMPEEEEDIELFEEEMKQLLKQMGAEEKGEAVEAAEAPSNSDSEDVLAEIMEEGGKAAEAKEEGEEPVSDADLQARAEQIAQELGAEMIASEKQPEDEPYNTPREPLHALTEEGKFLIDDSLTLTLPRKTMING